MGFDVIPILSFQRQAKRLIKRFPSLKVELRNLIEDLRANPKQGTPLGHNCFKVRLSIASKNKGKSGGARVVTCVYFDDNELYLLTIYDKSERSSLTDKEIKELLRIVENMQF